MSTEGAGLRVGQWFNIQRPDGLYLVAFFGGDPEWSETKAKARRYCPAAASMALGRLCVLGIKAAAVTE